MNGRKSAGSAPAAFGEAAGFTGFPSSGLTTVIPNVFFSRILPEIERPEELVVTAYLFYLHGRARGWPRAFSERQLRADVGLMRALSRLSQPPEGALAVGLSWAEKHGTVLRATVERDGQSVGLYMLNFPANRRALDRSAGVARSAVGGDEPLPPREVGTEPSNIFALYEANVGAITPLIADELKDAEESYPPEWIEAAFREAVSLNKRSWRYIHSILKRWEAEGPDYEEAERDPGIDWLERRYARGKRGVRRR